MVGPASADAAASGAAPAGLDALRRLVDAGAHPRKAAGVVAELDGRQRERALPGADGGGLIGLYRARHAECGHSRSRIPRVAVPTRVWAPSLPHSGALSAHTFAP